MKSVVLEKATLRECVDDAQAEKVVVTRNGKPVALVVGVEGMDTDQLELGSSERFWKFIAARRKQRTVGRAKLEQMIAKGTRVP
jgi:prevent-host-death family protein